MFYNYLKISVRNLLRHKMFSLINISGLALGMTCSILIFIWIRNEISFNLFHKNIDLLYRIMEEQHYPGGDDLTTDSNPTQLGPALLQEMPEVKQAARISWNLEQLLRFENKVFKEKGIFADNDFLKLFTFPLVAGDPRTALLQPHTIVISENLARKYFGKKNPIGKLLKVNNLDSYKVTGVAKNVPGNSSIQFDFLMPMQDFINWPENGWMKEWGNNGLRTYILLDEKADVNALNAKLKHYLLTKNPESRIDLFLQPVSEMYLHSDFRKGKVGGGQIENVRLFSIVAIFILVIACINFMNLSTARSAKRAKEVGVRKVVGASRSALIVQFLGESVLIAFLACGLSVNLAQALLPGFNALTGKNISINYYDPVLLFSLLGISLFTGILSGSYPAFFLSSFKPVSVLKGTVKFSKNAAAFRKGLVVFQFILSAVFIISTLVIYKQIHFIRNKNIGLERNNVLYMPLEGEQRIHYQAFKTELLQNPEIIAVSATDQSPITVSSSTGGVEWETKEKGEDVLFSLIAADYDLLKTMNIKLVAGRDFSREFATDSTAILINEEAARVMHLKDPVGRKITWNDERHIIGVVQNFHTSSMHNPMQPLIIHLKPENAKFIYVRTRSGQTNAAISVMGNLIRKYYPAYPFLFHFLDEDFEKLYKSETMMGKLATYFSGIAIFISLLGLFGLALFTSEQRTKEIGIRKVMGASVTGIVAMLSKDFLKLVLLANIIALPAGWYFMHNWLQDFAFRTELSWWIFALACLSTLLIALLTVSFHALSTALANPIISLRSE